MCDPEGPQNGSYEPTIDHSIELDNDGDITMNHMWAALNARDFAQCLFIPFLILFYSFSYFQSFFDSIVAPDALSKWAQERGIKLVSRGRAGLRKRLVARASLSQAVYTIVVQDAADHRQVGLAKLGGFWWPSLSVDACPIEVWWEKQKNPDDWPEF